jgi:hypothetical protein
LNGLDGVPEAVFVYWDTPDRRRSLIAPYIYEHAAHNDLEGRIIISRDSEIERTSSKYLWGYSMDELNSLAVPEALGRLSLERNSEFPKFLGRCYDAMFNNPNVPFRSVLIVKENE